MARITKAMQVAEYCENLRKELGIETITPEYDMWSTMRITDGGLFRFNDDKTVFALYGLKDMVSAESARKLGGRQYKKSMNEYLVGVYFGEGVSEANVWNFMNGKNVKIPRVYATSVKLIPVAKGDFFRHFDVTDDGLLEMELTAGQIGEFKFECNEIPKTGCITFPLRMRLSGGLPTGPIEFKETEGRHRIYIEFECGGEQYEFCAPSFGESGERTPSSKVLKWRARKDDEGVYLDVIMSYDYWR